MSAFRRGLNPILTLISLSLLIPVWAEQMSVIVYEAGADPTIATERFTTAQATVTAMGGTVVAGAGTVWIISVPTAPTSITLTATSPNHMTVVRVLTIPVGSTTASTVCFELPILELIPAASLPTEGGTATWGLKIRDRIGNHPPHLTGQVTVDLSIPLVGGISQASVTTPVLVPVPAMAGPAASIPFQIAATDDALPDGGVDVAVIATPVAGAAMTISGSGIAGAVLSGTIATGTVVVDASLVVKGGVISGTTTVLDNDIVGIPLAPGVPGNWQGPDWWGVPPAGRPVVDDPRWNGSLILTHDDGTSTAPVSLRSKYETGALYVQCQIKAAPVINGSHFYLGLSAPGGADPEAFLIDVAMTATTNLAASTSGRTVTLSSRALSGTMTPLSQTWTTDRVAVWTDIAGQTWTVALRIPFDATNVAGLNIGSDPALWYQVTQQLPASLTTTYIWPQGHPSDNRYSGTGAYPKTLNWGLFHLSTGPADMTATATGLTLETIDLGIKPHPTYAPNPLATNLILHKIGVPDVDRPENVFYVKVRNTAAIPAATNPNLKARFRIANWGSQVSDWISAPWDDVPGGSAVPCAINIPGLGQAGDNDQNFIWKLTDAEAGQYNDVIKHHHQCVMVELSGPGLVFLRSSVYRNMTTAPASVFTQSAEISIKGLHALSTPTRDVYLWVQTANMPTLVTAVPEPAQPQSQPTPDPKTRERDGQAAATGGTATTGTSTTPTPPTVPKPTYIVHVYHDTGLTVVGADGTSHKLLEPQTAFGYEMVHAGALTGWSHKLEGAELIAPDFYRIAIANGGVARVVSTIEAIEPSYTWLLWLLGILVLIILVLVIARRR